MKNRIISVQGADVTVTSRNAQDYISLTDMLRAKDGNFFISDWLRNRNTIEFMGVWESIYNPDFNYGEFAIIKSQAGLNSYKLSVKDWVNKTHAVGVYASSGRYGGTYAHKDIAFEFGMWISAEFKIYLIKEFQRLKDEESSAKSLAWSFRSKGSDPFRSRGRSWEGLPFAFVFPQTQPQPPQPPLSGGSQFSRADGPSPDKGRLGGVAFALSI